MSGVWRVVGTFEITVNPTKAERMKMPIIAHTSEAIDSGPTGAMGTGSIVVVIPEGGDAVGGLVEPEETATESDRPGDNTFANLTPRAMVVRLRGRKVPPRAILAGLPPLEWNHEP